MTQKWCLVPGVATWNPESCEGVRQGLLESFKASRAPRCELLWSQYFVTGIYLFFFLNPVWAKPQHIWPVCNIWLRSQNTVKEQFSRDRDGDCRGEQ